MHNNNSSPSDRVDFTNLYLGIELGSTRIKAVLMDEQYTTVATGSYNWENNLLDGIWTYDLEDVWTGVRQSYLELASQFSDTYGVPLKDITAIGISAMMHGYLVFDKEDKQLVPFRTWRNTTTQEAADILSEKFHFSIPQRWNIAHLYQAILNKEIHVQNISFMTTLAGYVHWKLTGKKVIGIGDASGMFPIDPKISDYNASMQQSFAELTASCNFEWSLCDILPEVLTAGADAGVLTEEGAKLLDPSGVLAPGSLFCPPEGDAGTGMVATNSVAERTGNVSAGTSVFAMIVLEKELSKAYKEIDIVTTPTGKPVAMVHCNNCTSDIDAWANLFAEFNEAIGHSMSKGELYDLLFKKALEGDMDCGKLLSYNYFSGEPITGLDIGRPLLVRMPDGKFSLANLMRNLLFSSMATLKIGMDILFEEEGVQLESLLGHGGLFKVEAVGQALMAAALETSISVLESAGEGGAWGIALLAAYRSESEGTLEAFLEQKVFSHYTASTLAPDKQDIESFQIFMKRYINGLEMQKAATTFYTE